MSAEHILEARDIAWRIGSETILDHVSLRLHEGEILTVIGPNGAGKTSLLRILTGLLAPSAGSVWRKPGLRIGYMPQRLVIDPSMPLDVGRFLRLTQRRPDALEAVTDEVGIRELLRTPLAGVSGGEFQRVLLARALLRTPQLLVLDEPVQGVDVNGQAELYGLINDQPDHARQGEGAGDGSRDLIERFQRPQIFL